MRVADILRLGDILQVPKVVVARVAIFVMHLPGIFARRSAKKGVSNHAMDQKVLSTYLHPEVATTKSRPAGNCPEGV